MKVPIVTPTLLSQYQYHNIILGSYHPSWFQATYKQENTSLSSFLKHEKLELDGVKPTWWSVAVNVPSSLKNPPLYNKLFVGLHNMDFFQWTLITSNYLLLIADTKTSINVSFCKTTDNFKLNISLCCSFFSLLSHRSAYALVRVRDKIRVWLFCSLWLQMEMDWHALKTSSSHVRYTCHTQTYHTYIISWWLWS